MEMASKLCRIVLQILIFAGAWHSMFASDYASVTIQGSEQSLNGTWDSGTVTVVVNGHSETVSYGQYSTPASIASALGVKFTKSCGCTGGPACARAMGSELIFKGRNGLPINSVSVSAASTAGFATSSFWADASRGSSSVIPQINVLSPSSGKPGTQVIISGSGFGTASTGANLVTFDGEVAIATTWTDTSIVATVPEEASTGEVIVTAIGMASNGVTFTVTSDKASTPILNGTIYSYSVSSYEGNGNLTNFTDSITGQWQVAYDPLNRLSTGTNSGLYSKAFGQYICWTYDAFGNRLSESLSGVQCNSSPSPLSWANFTNNDNRVTGTTQATGGYQYDSAGNVKDDGVNQYAYDGEGRICAVYDRFSGSYIQYLYDADGNRIAKGTVNSLSCDRSSNGFRLTTQDIVGAVGEQVSELDGTGKWLHSNVYAGGQLLATYDSSGLHYNLTDALGTKRKQVLADLSADETCSSLPFGNMLDCWGKDDEATEHHFTAKERDAESGNDYFGARYYASTMGRFISPDPQGNSYADFSNPQSWNMYAYVLNNPFKFTDPTGMYCYYGNTDFSSEQGQKDQNDATQWDYHSNSGECGKNGGQWYDDALTHGGFDDAGRPDYAVSTNTQASNSPQPTAGQALQDLETTIPGLQVDATNWALSTFLPSQLGGRANSFSGQDPFRLFGTHYCGPGGAGTTVGALDPACKVHDACYGAAPGGGISAGNNLSGGTPMTTAQAAQAKECNQALYDAARNHPDAPGSKAVQWWMVNGSHLPGGTYILYPGTEAVPW